MSKNPKSQKKTVVPEMDDRPTISFICTGKVLISEFQKINPDGTPGETVLSAKLLSKYAIDNVRDVLQKEHFPVFIHSAWSRGSYEYKGMTASVPKANQVWNCSLLLLEKFDKEPLVLCTPIALENPDNTIKNEEHRQIKEALAQN